MYVCLSSFSFKLSIGWLRDLISRPESGKSLYNPYYFDVALRSLLLLGQVASLVKPWRKKWYFWKTWQSSCWCRCHDVYQSLFYSVISASAVYPLCLHDIFRFCLVDEWRIKIKIMIACYTKVTVLGRLSLIWYVTLWQMWHGPAIRKEETVQFFNSHQVGSLPLLAPSGNRSHSRTKTTNLMDLGRSGTSKHTFMVSTQC